MSPINLDQAKITFKDITINTRLLNLTPEEKTFLKDKGLAEKEIKGDEFFTELANGGDDKAALDTTEEINIAKKLVKDDGTIDSKTKDALIKDKVITVTTQSKLSEIASKIEDDGFAQRLVDSGSDPSALQDVVREAKGAYDNKNNRGKYYLALLKGFKSDNISVRNAAKAHASVLLTLEGDSSLGVSRTAAEYVSRDMDDLPSKVKHPVQGPWSYVFGGGAKDLFNNLFNPDGSQKSFNEVGQRLKKQQTDATGNIGGTVGTVAIGSVGAYLLWGTALVASPWFWIPAAIVGGIQLYSHFQSGDRWKDVNSTDNETLQNALREKLKDGPYEELAKAIMAGDQPKTSSTQTNPTVANRGTQTTTTVSTNSSNTRSSGKLIPKLA